MHIPFCLIDGRVKEAKWNLSNELSITGFSCVQPLTFLEPHSGNLIVILQRVTRRNAIKWQAIKAIFSMTATSDRHFVGSLVSIFMVIASPIEISLDEIPLYCILNIKYVLIACDYIASCSTFASFEDRQMTCFRNLSRRIWLGHGVTIHLRCCEWGCQDVEDCFSKAYFSFSVCQFTWFSFSLSSSYPLSSSLPFMCPAEACVNCLESCPCL